jgi:ABC-2 type transport system ATP-binding protein
MSGHVLSLSGIVKTFGDFRLGPVHLDIEPGYVVAVVGPNGSGKSTLFRMIMNLLHADQGSIEILGNGYEDSDTTIKNRIGYVPERSLGHDEMSVGELGDFYARWYAAWDAGRYEASLTAMEVERDKPFGKLSKGLQRRVAFALAMATGPEVLLCDEPTDGVDPFARREMLSDITRFMEDGERTVLIATHNMDDVRRVADYVAFLVNGTLLGFYEKDALLDDWRRLWLDRAPEDGTPGIVRVEGGHPTAVVSSHWQETVRALESQGSIILRTAALELTEILEHLMRHGKAEPTGEELLLVHTPE